MVKIQQSSELFSDVIGQSYAVSLLESALKRNQIAPSYLFEGPCGVGRKLTALRFLEGIINQNHKFYEKELFLLLDMLFHLILRLLILDLQYIFQLLPSCYYKKLFLELSQ